MNYLFLIAGMVLGFFGHKIYSVYTFKKPEADLFHEEPVEKPKSKK